MRLQKGGDLIAQGSYGCVFRPALKCSDETKRQDGVVSKMLTTNEAKKEINENKVINKIDETNLYHLPPPKICKAEIEHFSEPGISRCKVIRGRSRNKFSILQYKDGGIELGTFLQESKTNNFFSNEKNIKNFFFSMYNLFVGLDDMYNNDFIHSDIKTQNIVYDPDKMKFNFIDFGLSGTVNKLLQKSNSIWGVGYFCYPYEVNLLEYDNYYYLKNPETIFWFPRLLNTLYVRSYAKTIDNKIFYNGSIYKPTWENPNILETYKSLVETLSFDKLSKEIVRKIDVFSMGIVLADVLGVITNKKINATQISSTSKTLFRSLHSLILNMVNPLYTTRFNATQVLEYYEKNIMPLVTDVIPIVKPPSSVRNIPKPPELTELIQPPSPSHKKTQKKCPEDKILNPKTGRCVNKTGGLGKKLLKQLKPSTQKSIKPPSPSHKKTQKTQKTQKKCPEDKILNPKTGRCVSKTGGLGKKLLKQLKPSTQKSIKPPSPSHKKTQKKCPEDKILNPKTGRCVSKTGGLGKKLLKQLKPSTQKSIKPPSPSHKKTQKKCPEDKILNPKTGRCVSKTGGLGKKLLKQLK
jgi:serine/threonine protein kinase